MSSLRTVKVSKQRLFIKPIVKISDDFAKQLLGSITAKGLSGQELLVTFEQAKNNIGWTQYKAVNEE